MRTYKVIYGFNVRRFLNDTIQANDLTEAVNIAREKAKDLILTENSKIENMDGYATHDRLDPWMEVYTEDGDEDYGEDIKDIDED